MKSNVREIMEQNSITLRALEDKTGLAQVTILRSRKDDMIEKCSLGTLKVIARALGVSVKDLFEDDITEDPPTRD
jgi:DNA-binding Xre family transcriptional regulator